MMDNSELVKKKRNRLAAKRMRYRNKAIRLGLAVPPAMGKQKTGRKVEVEATIQGDEKRQLARVHYTSRKQMKQVINCSNVRSLANNLRPRDSKGNENIAELAGGKILELCDQIASNFSNLRDAKETMKRVIDELSSNFTWLMAKDGCWKLFFVQTVRNETFYHPWLEVKISNVCNEDDGGFSYGLYACRRFKKKDCFGLYVGRVLVGKDEDEVSSIYKISVGEGVFHLDIDDKGEGRLAYGVGMHMMNDRHFGNVIVGPDHNNTMISWDLSVVAQKDIEKGEEMTLSYNYST